MTEKKSTYEVIFESCEEGIIVVNESGEVVLSNKACHVMFGYGDAEMEGKRIEALIPEKYRGHHAHHRKTFFANPSTRKMGRGRDLLGLKKNGEEFPIEASLNIVILNGLQHTIAYVIDITERKKIEQALKHSEEQLITYASELEKRVKIRTTELEKTNLELLAQINERKKAEEEAKKSLQKERELNELKSRFVTMASHEFRTPLSTILSSASLIERYETSETNDKRKKHVSKIKSSIANLTGILNDFLSLAKLEEGKVNLVPKTVDLLQLVNDVIGEMQGIKREGQTINMETSGTIYSVESDEKILKNILINLLSNAVKYSKGPDAIKITINFEEKDYSIAVKDQGIGIPEEEQYHLFERFFRAKNAINVQGTGLGLNIVKKYIDILGGDITFTSKLNEGTTFFVKLPFTYTETARLEG